MEERALDRLAVPDQILLGAVDEPLQAAGEEHRPIEPFVEDDEGRDADHRAAERVVDADDRVLHRVGDQEQDDQIEGVLLSELALPHDAEHHDEERVDDDRAQDLLEPVERQGEDGMSDARERHDARLRRARADSCARGKMLDR
ncbi:MAG: hypothetical protein E6G14_10935 [Actinobacteria bacterium]|nr:MAG: hypothetical protein E6G14_10935 [Actinomycetota bacterium]